MARPLLPLNTWGAISYSPDRKAPDTGEEFPPFTARARFRGPDGVTRQVKAKAATKGKARRALEERLRASAKVNHRGAMNSSTTMAALADAWLADRKPEVGKETFKGYRSLVKVHVKPRFGGIRLGEATTGTLEQVMAEVVAEEGRSVGPSLRTALSGMFGLAVRLDVMAVSPVDKLKTMDRVPRKHPRLAPADLLAIRSLLAAAENPLVRDDAGEIVTRTTGTLHGSRPAPGTPVKRSGPKPRNSWVQLFDLLLGTGMRIGEGLAVRYEDIDLLAERPTLTVSGTITDSPAERQPFPKTEAGHRVLTLPGWVVAMIMERQRLQAEEGWLNPQGLLFVTRNGTPVTPNNQRRLFRETLLGTPYEGIVPHDIRSAVATAVDDEIGLKAASLVLGHGSVVPTLVYLAKAHQAPDVTGVLEQFRPGGI